MKRLALLLGSAGLALAPSASAQAFNIDISSLAGTPAATFGAGSGQSGVWNSVPATFGSSPLVDLNGAPTPVIINCGSTLSHDFSSNNPQTLDDDGRLMDDYAFLNGYALNATWAIIGLAPGNYVLYTYAWSPYDPNLLSDLMVPHSSEGFESVGGQWNGMYIQGRTHAVHHVTITAADPVLTITVQEHVQGMGAILNGFQVVPDTNAGTVRCEPGIGTVISCPCSNPPVGLQRGCNNSSHTSGASIRGTGVPSLAADTLGLTILGETAQATSIVMQGTAIQSGGLVFGQGVRCVSGVLKRLYTQSASGGIVLSPPAGAPSISARSAALGDPISAGQNRWYLVYYRDPITIGCPATSTFNCTTTLEIAWQ